MPTNLTTAKTVLPLTGLISSSNSSLVKSPQAKAIPSLA